MTLSELISALQAVLDNDGDLPVRIATSPRKDEWYDLIDVTVEGHDVGNFLVLNTD